jgi:hypothetical protein
LTLLIFAVILYVIALIRRTKLTPGLKFKNSEIIALISLIATLVITIIAPFISLPILDYAVIPTSADPKENEFEIVIHNFGSKAENVIVSLKAKDALFRFGSDPFRPSNILFNKTSHSGIVGESLVEMGNMPSRGNAKLTVVVTNASGEGMDHNTELTTHVRSNESVGYHNTIFLVLFYGLLAASYGFAAFLFSYSWVKVE